MFERKNASEDLFKQTSRGFEGLLHISTYGFYQREQHPDYNPQFSNIFTTNLNPMLRCGLVFSGANRVWCGKEALTSRYDA